MKPMCRRLLASALAAVLMTAGAVRAQVMDQVPADALAVLKVKAIGATSAKLGKFLQDLGVASLKPGLEDPLGYLQNQANIKQGLDKDGELAFVYRDPTSTGAPDDKSMLILIPVSDYNAFVANFAGAKNDGDITEVNLPNTGEPSFMAHWGNFAVLAPGKEALAKPASGMLKLSAEVTNKELASKDVVVFGNIAALKTKFLPKLKENREQILADADQRMSATPEMAKFSPVLKAALNKGLDLAEAFLNDTQAVTYSLNFGAEGINLAGTAEFAPDTYMAKLAGEMKGSSDSLLKGLPAGKYILFGGSSIDPKVASKVFDDLTGSVVKEIAALGPDYQPIIDYIDATKTIASNTTGGEFGLIAPSGALGQESILQMVSMLNGNGAVLKEAQLKLMKSQQDAMKAIGMPADAVKTALTPAAKTIDGVAFDSFSVTANPDSNSPGAQQQAQVMGMMYGPNGLTSLIGDSGNGMIAAIGVNDALVSATLAASKAGTSPLADNAGVKSVAGNLPKSRFAEVYFPIDQLVTTGLGYAKQFGAPVNMQLPADLPPIGYAASTEGNAFRVDAYVPSSLVQSLVAATMQVMMQMQGGGGGGGGL